MSPSPRAWYSLPRSAGFNSQFPLRLGSGWAPPQQQGALSLSASLGISPKTPRFYSWTAQQRRGGRTDGSSSVGCSRPLTSSHLMHSGKSSRKGMRRRPSPWQPFPLPPAGVRLAPAHAHSVCLYYSRRRRAQASSLCVCGGVVLAPCNHIRGDVAPPCHLERHACPHGEPEEQISWVRDVQACRRAEAGRWGGH